MKILFAVILAASAGSARADALSELLRSAGPAADLLAQAPLPKPVAAAAAARPGVVRVTSSDWNERFPLSREQVKAAGRKAGTKAHSRFSCEWREGAEKATCDFAYDVWPEQCWYGFDHAYADVSLADPDRPVVTKREWRAD